MKKLVASVLLFGASISLGACQVNKTQNGKLPKVQLKTSSGQLPKYDVQGPKLQVQEKTHTFRTPSLHVTTPNHK